MARKTKQELTEQARLESQLRALQKTQKERDREKNILMDELSVTQKALADAIGIMERKPKRFKIKQRKATGTGQASAVLLISDVHCEEIVPAHKVNYLGKHNPDISKKRMERLFQLALRFIRIHRQEMKIDELVLWLGGDFFTSDMHGAPTAFPPIIAAQFAEDMLVSGITFLLENEPNLKIRVLGSVGNHSRKDVGKRVNKPLEQEFSLEWMMFGHIQKLFKGYEHIEFDFQNSYLTYAEIQGMLVRFMHGHLDWRYNKGMAGVHGPLWKQITEVYDKQIPAQLTCFGHYHTYVPAGRERAYIGNGSVIGPAPYGLGFGAEEPLQSLFFIHSRYGVIGQTPLLLT